MNIIYFKMTYKSKFINFINKLFDEYIENDIYNNSFNVLIVQEYINNDKMINIGTFKKVLHLMLYIYHTDVYSDGLNYLIDGLIDEALMDYGYNSTINTKMMKALYEHRIFIDKVFKDKYDEFIKF